jgi:hypothetical protein
VEYRPRICAVGQQLLEEGELSEQRGQDHQTAVVVLNTRRGSYRVKQQTQHMDKDVALLAFDQFACIKPVEIDGPPTLFPRSLRSGWPRIHPARDI